MEKSNELFLSEIKNKIYNIRGFQVMFDYDLAELYCVEIKQFNRSVKRNKERFPEDFSFQLSENEFKEFLRCQFGTLKNTRGSHRKYLPYVFTEQGISMLSNIINSKEAIQINILVIRAFVLLRKLLKFNTFNEERMNLLENKQVMFQIQTEKNFEKIFSLLENPQNIKNQGIFYENQIFESHIFISSLIKSAKSSIILIDNYVNETTLLLFNKRNENVNVTIYTKLNENLLQDLKKFNLQYNPIIIKEFTISHDRFLIIDEVEIYHIGASLKDLGKKWFAFSKLNKENLNILEKLV